VNPQILFIPVSILPTHAIIEGLPATAVAKFNPKYAYIYLPLLLQKLIQNTLISISLFGTHSIVSRKTKPTVFLMHLRDES